MLNNFANVSALRQMTKIAPVETLDEIPDGTEKSRKQCFAIVSKLSTRLVKSGLSDKELWQYVKTSHKVESRKDLSELEWVTLVARFDAAEKDSVIFDVLVDAIKTSVGTCRAYRVYADARFRKVYDGIITEDIEERTQRYADATGCIVRLHGSDGADGIIFFEPVEFAYDPDLPPIGEFDPNKPTRVFEVRTQGRETEWVSIPFPDCSDLQGWGQRHADETGHEIQITDRSEKNVLMSFTPTPPAEPPTPPEPIVVEGVNDVTIDGKKWLILSQWDDAEGKYWHWVSLDQSMQRHIASASDRKSAVESLVNFYQRCSMIFTRKLHRWQIKRLSYEDRVSYAKWWYEKLGEFNFDYAVFDCHFRSGFRMQDTANILNSDVDSVNFAVDIIRENAK